MRFANDGVNNVILLGVVSTTWRLPQIAITEVIAGNNNITGWGTGWSIAPITSETGIVNIETPILGRVGNLLFSSAIPTTTPTSNSSTFNSYMLQIGSQRARLGVVDAGGGSATRYMYLQNGFTGSELYYHIVLNPNASGAGHSANVGIGEVLPD